MTRTSPPGTSVSTKTSGSGAPAMAGSGSAIGNPTRAWAAARVIGRPLTGPSVAGGVCTPVGVAVTRRPVADELAVATAGGDAAADPVAANPPVDREVGVGGPAFGPG